MIKKQVFGFLFFGLISHGFGSEASDIKIKPYGFIKLETIYDNTEVVQGDWLLYVKPGDSPQAEQSIFTMNARHSRIGLTITGSSFGNDGQIKGLIETDFAGGFPNSSTAARQPQLRLRHAWVEISKPCWELRFGQDWALISGPFPNTTSFVVGAGKGNLWMRYPQIKYTWKRKAVKAAISMNRPMAGNIKYDDFTEGDFDPVGDGERSGMPWMMGRIWFTAGKATMSVSGHYGQEQINDLSGSTHDLKSFSMNADLQLTTGPVSWIARGFIGENLNSFFGGVFQGYTKSDNSVQNIASKGGWGQAVYKLNDKCAVTLGGGMDDPDDNNLNGTGRSRNDWLFGNVAWNFNNNLIFMLEAEHLKTSYLNAEDGENLRLQFVTYLKF